MINGIDASFTGRQARIFTDRNCNELYIEDNPKRAIAMDHGTQVGTMVAVSDDPLLLNWEKVTGKAVIPYPKPGEPNPPFKIFDPCL
jgi:beta-fructofuranosidase